ncbi:MAG: putative heme transporter [Miltoncostaeaceae bacterium]|nr:putative heme transporter [Miltoncostaeaceae bacterium]
MVAVAAYVLIEHVGVGDALADLRNVSPGWTVLAIVTQIATLMAVTRYGRRLFGISGVALPLHEAVPIIAADTALALSVSGGTLLGSGYARRRVNRAGADPSLVSSVSWLALLLSAAVVGLVVTLATADTGNVYVNGLFIAVVCLAIAGLVMAVQRPGIVRSLDRKVAVRWTRASRWLDAAADRLERLRMTRRDWGVVLFFGGWAAVVDAACLYACGRAVGAPGASLGTALLGYAAVQTALCFPITPGALGIAEAALYLALVSRHIPREAALTWTLSYRLLSFWGVLVVGWTSFLVLRRGDRGRAALAEVQGAAEGAPPVADGGMLS